MKRVFIVEDHELVLESYVMLLELTEDIEVAGTARAAEEALEALTAAAPDLVLADISLPGMSGIELLRRLATEAKAPPVLMITGHDDQRYRQEAREAGACGFVLKHEGPEAMLDAVRESLKSAG